MYADDLALGLSYKYSHEYVDAWERAYLEGRESFEDFDLITDYVMQLVGLTFTAGIVTVMGPSGSVKQIHVDNLRLVANGGDDE